MRYLPYVVALGIFTAVVLIVPPRTARFSFPAPKPAPRVAEKKKADLPALPARALLAQKPKQIVQADAKPLPTQKTVADIPIDLRSVVALKCVFKNADGNRVTTYGSGVIIGAEGYILTARHVVDMAYTYRITGGRQGLQNYFLDSCRIAVPPDGVQTPTAVEIRTINPFTPVTEFAYVAQVAFVPLEPATGGMSDGEYDFADSALLRITSAVNGAVPHSFVASPMDVFTMPVAGDEVVSFGFPSGVPSYGNNFYLQGSVGELKDIVGGDQLFKDQPMGMVVTMETIGGRSGSPVFSHGYVIGTVSAKEDYSRNTAVAGIFPLARFAEDAGIAVFK